MMAEERRALFDDVELRLTAREFDVLALLAERPGWVLTAGQLAADDHVVGASPNAVNVHIAHLRAKLADAGAPPDLIETVRGVGWRLKRPSLEKLTPEQRTVLAGQCIASARRSVGAYEFELAVASLDEALEHVENSGLEALRRDRVCSAVLERRGAAYSALGRYADARSDYEQALARRPKADHRARARLHTRIAYTSLFARSRGAAEKALAQAMRELEQDACRDRGWWQAWIEIRIQRIQATCITDLPLCSGAAADDLRGAVESYGTAAQHAKYHLAVADMLFYEARWAATSECLAESRLGFEWALQSESMFLQSLATGELGSMLVYVGEYHEAEIRLQQTIDFARRCRDTVGPHAATMFLSLAARLQGDVRRAEHFALELRSTAGRAGFAAGVRVHLAGATGVGRTPPPRHGSRRAVERAGDRVLAARPIDVSGGVGHGLARRILRPRRRRHGASVRVRHPDDA